MALRIASLRGFSDPSIEVFVGRSEEFDPKPPASPSLKANDEGWPEDYIAVNRAAYDVLAPEYRARISTDATRDPCLIRPFVQLLRNSRHGHFPRVLDVGCGGGLNLAMFAAEAFDATGIDISLEMLRVAKDTCPTAHLIHGDFLKHHFASAAFHGVFAKAIIHLFTKNDAITFLARAYDLLVPGGTFYVTTTVNGTFDTGLRIKSDYPKSIARYRRVWTSVELLHAVRGAGFASVQSGMNEEPERGKSWFSIWAQKPLVTEVASVIP